MTNTIECVFKTFAEANFHIFCRSNFRRFPEIRENDKNIKGGKIILFHYQKKDIHNMTQHMQQDVVAVDSMVSLKGFIKLKLDMNMDAIQLINN